MQAGTGANFIRYPSGMALADIKNELAATRGKFKNTGEKYAAIIRKIADRRKLPVGLIRSVLISIGYTAARGAWCRVDGRYIENFAFNENSCGAQAYYTISLFDLMELIGGSRALSESLRNRDVVYADGHVCVNSPEFVYRIGDEWRLTDEALARVDICCVKFIKDYDITVAEYDDGVLYYSDEQLRALNKLANVLGSPYALIDGAYRENTALKNAKNFGMAVRNLRMGMGISQEELADRAMLDRKTIGRIENDSVSQYSLSTVMGLAQALRLCKFDARLFFQMGGYADDHSQYGTAINLVLENLDNIDGGMYEIIEKQLAAIKNTGSAEKAMNKFSNAIGGLPEAL